LAFKYTNGRDNVPNSEAGILAVHSLILPGIKEKIYMKKLRKMDVASLVLKVPSNQRLAGPNS
jgi:hypothetical protein